MVFLCDEAPHVQCLKHCALTSVHDKRQGPGVFLCDLSHDGCGLMDQGVEHMERLL